MDRFLLEEEISKLLNVCDDIDLLTENVLETEMSRDEIANVTLGISTLLRLRYEKIFDVFKQVFQLDNYKSSVLDKPRDFV
jgi:hypothetical protein